MSHTPVPELVQTYRRALESGDGLSLPVFFGLEVLRRYQVQGASLSRTDHVGRLILPGRFGVDFGLVDAERVIHLTFSDFLYRVPERERDHWLAHLVTPAVSARFLRMRLRPSCVDDGELRDLTLD